MDDHRYVLNRLRGMNLPAQLLDNGEFVLQTGRILETRVPAKGLLQTYRRIYSGGIAIVIREVASAVIDEVEEIQQKLVYINT